jgi:hypothetical protein
VRSHRLLMTMSADDHAQISAEFNDARPRGSRPRARPQRVETGWQQHVLSPIVAGRSARPRTADRQLGSRKMSGCPLRQREEAIGVPRPLACLIEQRLEMSAGRSRHLVQV